MLMLYPLSVGAHLLAGVAHAAANYRPQLGKTIPLMFHCVITLRDIAVLVAQPAKK
jgi:hypothetical protein